jgi:hypothetical protein
VQAVLADIPASVDTVVFPNYESMPERDDITDPFTEVAAYFLPIRIFDFPCYAESGSALAGTLAWAPCAEGHATTVARLTASTQQAPGPPLLTARAPATGVPSHTSESMMFRRRRSRCSSATFTTWCRTPTSAPTRP